MGKLDMVKGQPAYLADKPRKRKERHEPDQGEGATGHLEKVKKPRKPKKFPDITSKQVDLSKPWRILNTANHWTSSIPTVPAYPPTIDAAMPGSSKEPGPSFSADLLRSAKKAKVSALSTSTSTAGSVCPLCGGPKHKLRDCLVPKGGVEK